MNQSHFLAIIWNLLKAPEKSRVHGAIGFGFASHWLKNWRESFKPIIKRSNRNDVITFDSHLKTALLVHLHTIKNNGNARLLLKHFNVFHCVATTLTFLMPYWNKTQIEYGKEAEANIIQYVPTKRWQGLRHKAAFLNYVDPPTKNCTPHAGRFSSFFILMYLFRNKQLPRQG